MSAVRLGPVMNEMYGARPGSSFGTTSASPGRIRLAGRSATWISGSVETSRSAGSVASWTTVPVSASPHSISLTPTRLSAAASRVTSNVRPGTREARPEASERDTSGPAAQTAREPGRVGDAFAPEQLLDEAEGLGGSADAMDLGADGLGARSERVEHRYLPGPGCGPRRPALQLSSN